jgi:uncharacterized protein YodC (DUF2158 family)
MGKNISIGDVVSVRSGGPSMIVKGFEKLNSDPATAADFTPTGENGLVRCVWFDQSGKLQQHAFPAILLDVKDHLEDDAESGKAPKGGAGPYKANPREEQASGTQHVIERQDRRFDDTNI